MPNRFFAGQTIVVLGGSSGVGFSITECALAEGAQIVIGSSHSANVEAAVRHLGPARLVGRLMSGMKAAFPISSTRSSRSTISSSPPATGAPAGLRRGAPG